MFFFLYPFGRYQFNKTKTTHKLFKDYLVATDESWSWDNRSTYFIFDDFSGIFLGYDYFISTYPLCSFKLIAGVGAYLIEHGYSATLILMISFFLLGLWINCCYACDKFYKRRSRLVIGYFPTRKFLEFLDYMSWTFFRIIIFFWGHALYFSHGFSTFFGIKDCTAFVWLWV